MKSGIYRIRNTVTGKGYIGSAVSLAGRKSTHWTLLLAGKHRNAKLQNSWSTHGERAFVFEVLVVCAARDLLDYEQRCIDGFAAVNDGYNILSVAGSALGFRHSQEHRSRLVGNQLARGLQHSPETLERLRVAALGNQHSLGHRHAPEFGAAMSARWRGVSKSAAHKAAIGAAHKGMKRSEQAKENMRAAWERRRQSHD